MSVQVLKRLLLLAAAALALGFGLSATQALRSNPMPYRFEGYKHTATTRLAILSITNERGITVEFTGPVRVVFKDGWQPKWGSNCVVCSALTIGPKGSGKWVFEVPPHEARWRVTSGLQKHTFMERLALRLSAYSRLGWIARFARPGATTFSSDWVNE